MISHLEVSAAALAVALLATPAFADCPASTSGAVAVPTAEEAITEARNAWESIYDKTGYAIFSEENAAQFEPYTATLENGEWTVRGTIPAGYRGDTLVTTICQSNGFTRVAGVRIE